MESIDNSIVSELNVAKRLYVVEWFRQNSFKKWKGPTTFNIDTAAEMGFYYIDSDLYNDVICCIHCDMVLFTSTFTNNIEIEHAKNSPNCNPGFNIPQKFTHLTQYIINSFVHLNLLQHIKCTNNTKHPLYNKYTAFMQQPNCKNKTIISSELVSLYSKDTLEMSDLCDDEKEGIELVYNNIKDFILPEFKN